MFDFLRTRLAQGTQTSSFPKGTPEFPERFRGRPALECDGCGDAPCPECRESTSTTLVRSGDDGRAVLDLGACLFSPEEATGRAGCGVRFTHDHRMASRARDGLVTPNGEAALATALDARMRKLFGRSLRLRSVVAGSCNGCESELNALGNVVFDMGRFGVQFVASPRHADGIVITGAVNANMREALERTYAAVPDPRLVIAVGACTASGGPFQGSPEIEGVPENIPVDLWIPGCPPHPLTVLDGLLRLLGRLTA
jgi:Ni,Fe-hydrogenase III small subunit